MAGLFDCPFPGRRDGHRTGALEAKALDGREGLQVTGMLSLNSPYRRGISSLQKAEEAEFLR